MTRPLLICDCDEVLMQFAQPFAAHLDEEHGLELKFRSFALSGNIHRKDDGSEVEGSEVSGLVADFFRRSMHRQIPVPGAADALERLSSSYDIVILTNIEDEFQPHRREQIRAAGMDYEVYCNRGPKGPALERLISEHEARQAVFVDDLPPHHSSVAKRSPFVHRLHMVADPVLRELIPPAEDADARIDEWSEAVPYLEALVRDNRLALAPDART